MDNQAASKFMVTGATGNQGGALVRQLLASGQQVSALVRNPESAAAQELSKLGAKLFKGDFDDKEAIASASSGCYGVFLNTSPTAPSELELTHASNIIEAAVAAKVQRIVYSSVTCAEEHEKFPTFDPEGVLAGYWRAKTAIQAMVQTAGIDSWTILQPAWIMANWVAPVSRGYWPELAEHKTLVTAFGRDTRIHLTDPEDTAKFAARALTSKSKEMDQRIIKVAGDDLTIHSIAAEMSRVSGKTISVSIRSNEEIESLKRSNPLVATQLWQRESGSQVDFELVKTFGIELNSFSDFLNKNRERLIGAFD